MLTEGSNESGCDRALILIDDREDDAFAAVARLSGRSDECYNDDRHGQQRYRAKAVAAYKPKVLEHHGEHCSYASLPALPYLRCMSAEQVRRRSCELEIIELTTQIDGQVHIFDLDRGNQPSIADLP